MTPPDNAGAATASQSRLTDFPDRLSPMLVKELRQGMRTRIFTSAFILLQALLLFSTFIASLAPAASPVLDRFFWFIMTLFLSFIQPLRGINALNQETRLNTLELILLTKLDALRIVTGKWASIVGQSALISVAVLPYVVLRYFLGGIDIIHDLAYLAILLCLSAMLTALTVGFSAFSSIILRGILFVGAAFSTSSIVGAIMSTLTMSPGSAFGMTLTTGGMIATAIGMFFTGAFITYYLLDMGAGRIAPPSANHATRKRLLSTGVILLLFSLPFLGVDAGFSLGIATAIAVIACIDSLTEMPGLTAGIYSGVLYQRYLPPFARYLLAPGWHTGINFSIFISILFWGFVSWQYHHSIDVESIGVFLAIVAGLLFPVLIYRLFLRGATQLMNLYVIVQCIATTIASILATASGASSLDWVLWTGSFLPHVNFAILVNSSANELAPTLICGVLILFTIAIAHVHSRPLFREMTRTYKIARRETHPESPSST